MSSEREQTRLADIIENIDRIANYVGDMDLEEFIDRPMLIDACERCLQRITEAAVKIGEQRMGKIAPDIPFHVLRGLGNVLRHEYDQIDDAIVFETIRQDLPPLKAACMAAIHAQ